MWVIFLNENISIAEAKNSTQSGINYTTTATIAKELLDAGTSPTAEAIISQSSPVKKDPTEDSKSSIELSPSKIEPNNNNIEDTKSTSSHGGIRATDQLLYLADLLKFEVEMKIHVFLHLFRLLFFIQIDIYFLIQFEFNILHHSIM